MPKDGEALGANPALQLLGWTCQGAVQGEVDCVVSRQTARFEEGVARASLFRHAGSTGQPTMAIACLSLGTSFVQARP